MKAIIVDDSRVIRSIIERAIKSIGFDAYHAGNGQDALDLLKENAQEVELVILDWNMPVLNGLDTLKAIRKNKDYNHICILMISTEAEEKNIETALSIGAHGYLTKPFEPEELAEKIRVTLARSESV